MDELEEIREIEDKYKPHITESHKKLLQVLKTTAGDNISWVSKEEMDALYGFLMEELEKKDENEWAVASVILHGLLVYGLITMSAENEKELGDALEIFAEAMDKILKTRRKDDV